MLVRRQGNYKKYILVLVVVKVACFGNWEFGENSLEASLDWKLLSMDDIDLK
jgi:hypothetical protein